MSTQHVFWTGLMGTKRASTLLEQLLTEAGVTINGGNPWDPQIHNARVYKRFLAQGRLGLGEAYVDGWWDCEALDEFFCRVARAHLDKLGRTWRLLLPMFIARLTNPQRPAHAADIADAHYNIGNELFEAMLDRRMIYSCGYWREADGLDEAQEKKLDLVCRKLYLEPGMRVLDIGCGWGGLAQFAAEKYGVDVTGITVSQEQVDLGRQRCAGLPVELRLQDYRDMREKYDRVVSLGMFEHVGYKNYRRFMEVVHRCLRDDGLFLLHTIGARHTEQRTDPWMTKYIFPNAVLPSVKYVGKAAEELFVMEDWHNFGSDYDKTLMAWYANFERNWPKLADRFSPRFYRIWRYYLLFCAGAFRARYNQLWQIVFSKDGVPGGYRRMGV